MNAPGITIRPYRESDDVHVREITALLHAAYGKLAAAGFRFHASHQDDGVTLRRLTSGTAFLASESETGRLVGTVTVYPPNPDSCCVWYRQPGHFHFGQFAVLPALQNQGIGRALYDQAERAACLAGATELALDTAEGAVDLIDWYTRLGFRLVDREDWDITNYASVVLSKSLTAG